MGPAISAVLMVAGSGPRSTGPTMSVDTLWFVAETGARSTEPAADTAVGSIGLAAGADVGSIGSTADTATRSTEPAADAATGSIGSAAQAARSPPLTTMTATRKSPTRFGPLFPILPSWPRCHTGQPWSMTERRKTPAPRLNTKLAAANTPFAAVTIVRPPANL